MIIELLSDSTANVDRTLKKNLYQSHFHTPEYFWFSPETLEFVGFELVGNQYQEIVPNSQGWRWSQVLGLYLGIHENKLRYFTAGGDLVPTPEEVAFIAQQQAQQATARANDAELLLQQERERSQRLAEQLRSLGIEPDNLTYPDRTEY